MVDGDREPAAPPRSAASAAINKRMVMVLAMGLLTETITSTMRIPLKIVSKNSDGFVDDIII